MWHRQIMIFSFNLRKFTIEIMWLSQKKCVHHIRLLSITESKNRNSQPKKVSIVIFETTKSILRKISRFWKHAYELALFFSLRDFDQNCVKQTEFSISFFFHWDRYHFNDKISISIQFTQNYMVNLMMFPSRYWVVPCDRE